MAPCLGAGSLGHCLEAFQAFKLTSEGSRVQRRGLGSVQVSLTDHGHAKRITPNLHRALHSLNTSLYTLPYSKPGTLKSFKNRIVFHFSHSHIQNVHFVFGAYNSTSCRGKIPTVYKPRGFKPWSLGKPKNKLLGHDVHHGLLPPSNIH